MFCKNCGAQIDDKAVVCVNCGFAVNNAPQVQQVEDKVSVGLVILAVLIPLFGFIYWPVKYKERPRAARACGIAAIISFAVSFVLSIVLLFVGIPALSWFLYEAYI